MAVTEANNPDFPLDRYEVWGHRTTREQAKPCSDTAHAMVPEEWLNERVKVIRLTRTQDEQPRTVRQNDYGRYVVHGYSLLDKEPGPISNGAHVYLPEPWTGETVQIIRVTIEGQETDGDSSNSRR